MKNCIFVINKEKIYAYIVSISTIIMLFFMSSFINNNFGDEAETSSNIVENVINEENQDNNLIKMSEE